MKKERKKRRKKKGVANIEIALIIVIQYQEMMSVTNIDYR